MRRLEAIFRDRRKSVSSRSRLGKTEKSTALRNWTAERKTNTEAENEQANRRSSTAAGTGTSMTKRMLMAATGSHRSFPAPARRAILPCTREDFPAAGTAADALIIVFSP